MTKKLHFETQAIQATEPQGDKTGSVANTIYPSTTFKREADGSFASGYIYSRKHNPNRQLLESSLAQTQMPDGCGAMLSIQMGDNQAQAMAVISQLKPFTAATSLGGVESLRACPRIENLLQKSWICAISRFFSSNRVTILLKKSKNSPKSSFPSLRFLFSDKLLVEHRRSVEDAASLTPDNLIRISVGIEHIDDLINDWQQALNL